MKKEQKQFLRKKNDPNKLKQKKKIDYLHKINQINYVYIVHTLKINRKMLKDIKSATTSIFKSSSTQPSCKISAEVQRLMKKGEKKNQSANSNCVLSIW